MCPEYVYASLGNQLSNFSRFVAAFFIVYIMFPRFMFRKNEDDFSESLFSHFIKMSFFVIILGYILVIIKLFELVMIVLVFLLISYRRYIKDKYLSGIKEIIFDLQIIVYDYADGLRYPGRSIRTWLNKNESAVKSAFVNKFSSYNRCIEALVLISVMFYSAYLRFYDVFKNAALPFSDAFTLLSWTKHIEKRILFYEPGGEVYPRGFAIFMEFIHKFSFIDTLLVCRYSGALIGMLIVAGIYFFVSKMTGEKSAGIFAAAIYGIFGYWLLHTDWDRQSGYNSQEFALVFLLPTTYYYYKYIVFKKIEYLLTAFYGVCVMGLTHSLVMALGGIFMGMLGVYAFVSGFRQNIGNIIKMYLSGVVAVLISMFPLVVGYFMGIPQHSSSVEFLFAQTSEIVLPKLALFDYISMAGIALTLLSALFAKVAKRSLKIQTFVFMICAFTFLLYYFAAYTKSVVLVSRMSTFWALLAAVAAGFGYSALISVLKRIAKKEVYYILITASVILYLFSSNATYICVPYKMEPNSAVEQYLRIRKYYAQGTWIVFSQKEGFAHTYGKGYHEYIEYLLKEFDPSKDEKDKWDTLGEHVFVFYEKEIFKVNQNSDVYEIEAPYYAMKEKQKPYLKDWLDIYSKKHDNISVFFEDENIKVFYIHNPRDNEDAASKIWES